MKKNAVLIIIIFVVPMLLFFVSGKVAAAGTRETVENAYGYKISLVRYDGTGEPNRLGSPILIVHPSMMDEPTFTTGSGVPSSHEELMSGGGKYNLDQVFNPDWPDATGQEVDPWLGESYNQSETLGAYPTGSVNNPFLNFSGGGLEDGKLVKYETVQEQQFSPSCKSCSKEKYTCYLPMQVFIFRYMSDTRTVTYKKNMIKYDENYNHIYEDPSLTEANINNGSFIEKLRSEYLKVEKRNLEDQFGVSINEQDIDKFYFQIEVVQRKLLDEFEDISTYTVTWFDQDPPETYGVIWASKWEEDSGEDWCDNPDWRWLGTSCYKIVNTGKSQCREKGTETVSVDSGGCMRNYECDRQGGTNLGKKGCTGPNIYCQITTTTTREICVKTGYRCIYTGYYLNDLACPGGAYDCGRKQRHIILGHISNGWSEIVTSRTNGGEAKFLARAVNKCSSDEAKHCVLDEKDGVTCTGRYEYYIGPNKEKALVGPNSSYQFQLVGDCNSSGYNDGIQHLYLPFEIERECPSGKCCSSVVCAGAGEHTSDDYLRCAENYCEALIDYDTKGNARRRKKNCIINKCEYSYGVSPTNPSDPNAPDRESRNSCNNLVSPFTNNIKTGLTSSCNKVPSGVSLEKEKSTIVESCKEDEDTDRITDFDGNDKNDKIFVQRNYINKICKEEIGFEFKDLTKESLNSAGAGFPYPVLETANRVCRYYFNLEQWKFDYASAPARDPVLRKRMLYLLDMYNSENKSDKDTKNFDTRFTSEDGLKDDWQKYGKTNYEDEGFDFAKTTLNVDIEEKLVDDKIVTPTTQTMVITDAKNIVGDITDFINARIENISSLKTNVSLYAIDSSDYVTVVANNEVKKNAFAVKRYTTDAKGILAFGLQEMCVSTDGNANVTLAPGNGICGKSATGSDIIAKRWHYTDFKIKLNNSNPVKATATVYKNKSSSEKIYEDKEQCTYKVTDSSEKCELIVEISEGTMKSSKEMYADNATVKLKHRIASTDIAESITDKYKIGNNVQIESSTNNQITVIRRNAEDPHELEGKVRYKDRSGTMQEVTCQKKIVLKAKNTTCPFKCELINKNDTYYWIKVMNLNGEEIEENLNNYKYSYYVNTAAEFDLNKGYRNIVIPSIIDNFKAYIALKSKLKDDEELNAAVELGGCEAICHVDKAGCKDPCCEGSCKTKNCLKDLKSADTATVYNYCQDPENLKKDMNNFDSSEECFEICSYYPRCEYYGCDKTKAENFCTRFNEYGYTSKNQCMNECYADCSIEGKGQYLFRAVNVLNPFPNSDESDYPFEKGDRIVGSNWREMSEFITSDDDDRTTITGNNANQYVEYIIDLTPSDIRRIRQDTDASELNNEKRKRAVYAKLDRIKTSSNVIGEYKSNFIHNSQFSDSIFKTEHGSTIVLKDDKN